MIRSIVFALAVFASIPAHAATTLQFTCSDFQGHSVTTMPDLSEVPEITTDSISNAMIYTLYLPEEGDDWRNTVVSLQYITPDGVMYDAERSDGADVTLRYIGGSGTHFSFSADYPGENLEHYSIVNIDYENGTANVVFTKIRHLEIMVSSATMIASCALR